MKFASFTITTMLALSLLACGSGDEEGGGIIEGTGNEQPTYAVGEITGFGSIYVNGIEYHTTEAEFTVNGSQGQLEDLLDIGMIVTIDGAINLEDNTGNATFVSYEHELSGPVSAIEVTSSRSANITVLGYTITVNENTKIRQGELADLAVDNQISVSGYRLTADTMVATHLSIDADIFDSASSVDVNGIVSALNIETQQFVIGTQTIAYGNAMLVNFESATIENGQSVRVSGVLTDNTLSADTIKLKTAKVFAADAEVEISGFITSIISDNEIIVNDFHVDTSDTTFARGSANDIQINRHVEVEGSINAEGKLIASKVKFEKSGNTKLSGNIEAINTEVNTITLLGQTIYVDQSTSFKDNSDARVRYFSIADLAIGDRIQARAFTTDGIWLADEIKRKELEDDNEVSLRGEIESIDNTLFVISGVTVDVSQVEEGEITPSLTIGKYVEVEGVLIGNGTIQASEIELDDELNEEDESDDDDEEDN